MKKEEFFDTHIDLIQDKKFPYLYSEVFDHTVSIYLFSFPQAVAQHFEKRIYQNNLRILLQIKITTPIFETFLKNRLPLLASPFTLRILDNLCLDWAIDRILMRYTAYTCCVNLFVFFVFGSIGVRK
jgi:hypothetical protein